MDYYSIWEGNRSVKEVIMTREERQKEASDSFVGNEKSIIIAAPRFGKIKTTIDILRRLMPERVLVVYPRVDIQKGWDDDVKKWGWEGER